MGKAVRLADGRTGIVVSTQFGFFVVKLFGSGLRINVRGNLLALMDDEADDGPVDLCLTCGRADDEEFLILCDGLGCGNARHTFCCSPPLKDVPHENWYCGLSSCGLCTKNKKPERRETAEIVGEMVEISDKCPKHGGLRGKVVDAGHGFCTIRLENGGIEIKKRQYQLTQLSPAAVAAKTNQQPPPTHPSPQLQRTGSSDSSTVGNETSLSSSAGEDSTSDNGLPQRRRSRSRSTSPQLDVLDDYNDEYGYDGIDEDAIGGEDMAEALRVAAAIHGAPSSLIQKVAHCLTLHGAAIKAMHQNGQLAKILDGYASPPPSYTGASTHTSLQQKKRPRCALPSQISSIAVVCSYCISLMLTVSACTAATTQAR